MLRSRGPPLYGRACPPADLTTPEKRTAQIARVWCAYYKVWQPHAAVVIQAHWRGYWFRKQQHAKRYGRLLRAGCRRKLRDSAARVLQRFIRGFLGRIWARERKRAIITVQRWWRGTQVRKRWPRLLRDFRWRRDAAVEIQRHVRGFLARKAARGRGGTAGQRLLPPAPTRPGGSEKLKKQLSLLGFFGMRNLAATVVQKYYRGWKARKRLRWLKQQHEKKRRYAALVIQRRFRAWKNTRRRQAQPLPPPLPAEEAVVTDPDPPIETRGSEPLSALLAHQAENAARPSPSLPSSSQTAARKTTVVPAVMAPAPSRRRSLQAPVAPLAPPPPPRGSLTLPQPPSLQPGKLSSAEVGPLLLRAKSGLSASASASDAEPLDGPRSTPAELRPPEPLAAAAPAGISGQNLSPLTPPAKAAAPPRGSGGPGAGSQQPLGPLKAPPPHCKPGTMPMQQQRLQATNSLPAAFPADLKRSTSDNKAFRNSALSTSLDSGVRPVGATRDRAPSRGGLHRSQSLAAPAAGHTAAPAAPLLRSSASVRHGALSQKVQPAAASGRPLDSSGASSGSEEARIFNVIHAQVMALNRSWQSDLAPQGGHASRPSAEARGSRRAP